jgi:anti-sigma factor RsiW
VNPELEAKLSALLDGELASDEAAALREEIARRPELEARLAELSAVDEGLRALPGRPVPAELRARLGERIRAGTAAAPREARSGGGDARRAPARAPRRWLAAAALAAAAAAALALVVLPRLRSDETQVARSEPGPTAPQRSEPPPVAPVAPEPAPRSAEQPRIEIAEQPRAPAPAPEAEPGLEPLPEDLLDPDAEPAAADVAMAEDLPVIEVLDVLAELDELEGNGSG